MKKFWIALALVAPWMAAHAQYDGTPMQKTQEEAKKAELNDTLQKLMASGMSAAEILEKLQ